MDLTIKLEDPDNTMRRLAQISRDFPRVVERAQMRSVRILASKIGAGVRSLNMAGIGKLPKLDALTKSAHGKKSGGVLATNKSLCRVMNINGHLTAGYITSVDGVFGRWQEGGTIDLPPKSRRYLHIQLKRAGAPDLIIPGSVKQPERMVVDPIARKFGPELPRWIFSQINKMLDAKLKRAKSK